MQALIRSTSKLRSLVTNQPLVQKFNAQFSSSFNPGGREFERGRYPTSLDSAGGRDFERGRYPTSLDSVGGREYERGRYPRSLDSAGRRGFERGRYSRSLDYVRGIVEQDGRGIPGSAQFPRYNIEHNPDIVHIKLMRNNAFVTVTDSKGNKKIGASSGCLSEMKGGPKLSRYAADATAEHVGRLSRNLGLKSVVVKVNGFTHFKKKRQAIMSWKDGYNASQRDDNPIMYIEDTTRRPHNGCRLPKKRHV